MVQQIPNQPGSSAVSARFLLAVVLLFVGSGCAALIYEIVWFQLLQLVIGSSAVSLGVLLGTFMGGMCLGSLALPRLVSNRHHPLRVYAVLEIGIGVIGILILAGMPVLERLYAGIGGIGFQAILFRGLVSGLCLLPPTILMGATLPAIARWVETTPRGVAWLGFFYGGNIAGAVFGCLLAGFHLLRLYDVAVATHAAAALNLGVAAIALSLGAVTKHVAPKGSGKATVAAAPGTQTVYLVIALSGLCALASQVVWTRLLSLMLGGTVYAFSIILAVFLIGLGIGSSAGSHLARTLPRPRLALGICQLLLAGAVAWAAYMMGASVPYWPVVPSVSRGPWFTLQLDLLRILWVSLPATILWGASFPLALASVASRGQDGGHLVGRVYAANTIGAIAGALGFSMIVFSWIGSQQAQRVIIGVSLLAAVLMLKPLLWPARTRRAAEDIPPFRLQRAVALGGVLTLMGAVGWNAALPVPGILVAYGRNLPLLEYDPSIIHVGEGMNASIAVSEVAHGARNFHVSGKVVASNEPQDMRLQRMLAHVPALVHPQPRSVLVVGCGAGVTAGSFVIHPEVERILICEIEPLIPRAAATYFSKENHSVLDDARVELVNDDARHFVRTTRETFDVITSDPTHPWVKGAAVLYSKEYFELCRERLNPGGLMTQWVPLYESNLEAVKSGIATFFEVFPHGTLWRNDIQGEGYDLVLLGQRDPLRINMDELSDRLRRPDHHRVLASLREVGFPSLMELLATYGGRASELGSWLEDAQINEERNLRLQYLAGLGLNARQAVLILDSLSAYRAFPEDLFQTVSDQRRKVLRKLIEDPAPRNRMTLETRALQAERTLSAGVTVE